MGRQITYRRQYQTRNWNFLNIWNQNRHRNLLIKNEKPMSNRNLYILENENQDLCLKMICIKNENKKKNFVFEIGT